MQYYRMLDGDAPDRWYLTGMWDAGGVQLDPREFCEGTPLVVNGATVAIRTESGHPVIARLPLRVGVRTAGVPLDFTLGPFEVPVVTSALAATLIDLAQQDIQTFPMEIKGYPGDYFAVNATAAPDCLDPTRSVLERWGEGDGRPDKVGQPRTVYRLAVDPSRAGGRHLFRVGTWEVALIASDTVRQAFEAANLIGVAFEPV